MKDSDPADDRPQRRLTQREAYNAVTDTVTGPNVRLKDNLYQGIAIVVFAILGAPIGYFLLPSGELGPVFGIAVGAFLGLITGLLLSGAIIGIFRAIQHARGRHD
jgi:hypothetical protein